MKLDMERYNQELDVYGDKESVDELIEEWGVENFNKGYAIFDFDGTGMLVIEAIGELHRFADADDPDLAATYQAEKDGIKIIPVDELPQPFIVLDNDRRYYGWIDTPENRRRIAEYKE